MMTLLDSTNASCAGEWPLHSYHEELHASTDIRTPYLDGHIFGQRAKVPAKYPMSFGVSGSR
jgi:hypothetical protein